MIASKLGAERASAGAQCHRSLELLGTNVLGLITDLLPAECIARLHYSGCKALHSRLRTSVSTLYFTDAYRSFQLNFGFVSSFSTLKRVVFRSERGDFPGGIGDVLFDELPRTLRTLEMGTPSSFKEFMNWLHNSCIGDLSTHFPHLQGLQLSSTSFTTEFSRGPASVGSTMQSLSVLPLTSLQLPHVPLCTSHLQWLPKTLLHLQLHLGEEDTPWRSVALPTTLRSLVISRCGASLFDVLASLTELQTLDMAHSFFGAQRWMLGVLPRSLLTFSANSAEALTVASAKLLPPSLTFLSLKAPEVEGAALEHLPHTLETLDLKRISVRRPYSVEQWPRALTSLSIQVSLTPLEYSLLPPKLKHLPIDSYVERQTGFPFKLLPRALETLTLYFGNAENLIELKCTSSLTRLQLHQPMTEQHFLALSRFPRLRHLFIPNSPFSRYLSSLKLEELTLWPTPAHAMSYGTNQIEDSESSPSSRAKHRYAYAPVEHEPWVLNLPRRLVKLDAAEVAIDPSEFPDLPRSLTHLDIRVSERWDIRDIALLPRTIEFLHLGTTKEIILKTTVSDLAAALPSRLYQLIWPYTTIKLEEAPNDHAKLLLRPILRKCKRLAILDIEGTHPRESNPQSSWSLLMELKSMIEAELKAALT